MAIHQRLREQLIKELTTEVEKADAQIKKYQDTVQIEMLAKSSVTGGALATAARNACENRANAARQIIAALNQSVSWHREMLGKYR